MKSSAKLGPTYVILHDLGIVSTEEGCGEPSQVELDVSLCCLYVPLVGDIHWFPPVSCQGDSNQPWDGVGNVTKATFYECTPVPTAVVLSVLPFCLFRH